MNIDEHCPNICAGFLESARLLPDRPALEIGSTRMTYAMLKERAASIAAAVTARAVAGRPSLVAVFACRSVTAFAGVLGVLMNGHGYVPLNMSFPVERTRQMFLRSGSTTVIVDKQSEVQLPAIIDGAPDGLLLVLPDSDNVDLYRATFPQHEFLGARDLATVATEFATLVRREALAYILFTSGSTGSPKGVMVSHANVRHYVDYMVQRYEISQEDRCSQNFDLTFDLSAHDMFVTWERGACLCCPTRKSLLNPGQFIVESRLTIWFSVPSTAIIMKKLGALKPVRFPALRLSLFCGEALPADIAAGWAAAASNSVIENIYGPTELTIACTVYRWDGERSPSESELGLVPIGSPIADMETIVVDEGLNEVSSGESGELLVAGPQVTLGYLDDEERTSRAFVVPPGKRCVYYRTGDRVRQAYRTAPLVYLGRLDNQVKVAGYRVELGEIEAAVRADSGMQVVVALGWPINAGGVAGIEVFVEADQLDTKALQARLSKTLPGYMLPRRVHLLPSIPLNINGKFDRVALARKLDAEGDTQRDFLREESPRSGEKKPSPTR